MPRILGGKRKMTLHTSIICVVNISVVKFGKKKKENVLMIILCAPVHDSSLHVYVREFREASIACTVNQA